MLGLTYLNRWYNVNIWNLQHQRILMPISLISLAIKAASTLDTIIALSNSGMKTFERKTVPVPTDNLCREKQRDLFTYLESLRELFLPHKTNSEWFKRKYQGYITPEIVQACQKFRLSRTMDHGSKYTIKGLTD